MVTENIESARFQQYEQRDWQVMGASYLLPHEHFSKWLGSLFIHN
jgi:hypothetical protein